MADLSGIDLGRMRELEEAENARFVAERPRSMELQARARRSMPRGVPMSWMDDLYEHPPVWVTHSEGPSFTDVDGWTYLDMYVADMSAFCGHAPEPVIEAVASRMRLGNQFLLPSEDAIVVAEHLADRYGLPKWQFTLSATQANTAVIRLARELTGREIVLMFDAKYGGLSRDWGLEPDFLTFGKAIAAGVPLATYGMRDEIAALIAPPEQSRTLSGAFVDEVATGGTLFANALSMAAGRSALLDVLTEEAFERTAVLGARAKTSRSPGGRHSAQASWPGVGQSSTPSASRRRSA